MCFSFEFEDLRLRFWDCGFWFKGKGTKIWAWGTAIFHTVNVHPKPKSSNLNPTPFTLHPESSLHPDP
jgi:hypothetical protein